MGPRCKIRCERRSLSLRLRLRLRAPASPPHLSLKRGIKSNPAGPDPGPFSTLTNAKVVRSLSYLTIAMVVRSRCQSYCMRRSLLLSTVTVSVVVHWHCQSWLFQWSFVYIVNCDYSNGRSFTVKIIYMGIWGTDRFNPYINEIPV